jgi:hypothetical protein
VKNIVFVRSASGIFVQHGPVRRSEAQAETVARLLRRKLGWDALAAASLPEPVAADASAPSEALAGLSPVWRDAELARRWKGEAPAPVVRVAGPREFAGPVFALAAEMGLL